SSHWDAVGQTTSAACHPSHWATLPPDLHIATRSHSSHDTLCSQKPLPIRSSLHLPAPSWIELSSPHVSSASSVFVSSPLLTRSRLCRASRLHCTAPHRTATHRSGNEYDHFLFVPCLGPLHPIPRPWIPSALLTATAATIAACCLERDHHRPRTPRTPRQRKTTVRMDPDCAICHAPATLACDCEAKGLDVAIKQAEHRMMNTIYNEIRTWVRAHAQDYILEYFRLLTERRKAAHTANLERITAQAYHYYHTQPHPNEIAEAQASLKRGIDEDWQSSVQRYPEVLEYFYSLVDLTLPPDDDPTVKDPPLSALSGSRKTSRRIQVGGRDIPAIAGVSSHEKDPFARRTPPPFEHPRGMGRRTPAPRDPRENRRSMPPAGLPPGGPPGPPAPFGSRGMPGMAGMAPPPGPGAYYGYGGQPY
ncbi:hypothetical protein CGCVW01_v007131, partial [Colletotrichum viniferum]